MVDATFNAIRRHHLEYWYVPQGVPGIGAVISTGLVTYSLANIALEIFQFVYNALYLQNPRNTANNIKNLQDFSLVLVNNALNVVTLGILNIMLVNFAVKFMKFN